jgi:hypothetical protein
MKVVEESTVDMLLEAASMLAGSGGRPSAALIAAV